jgi:ATP-dependent helicase/nuclease subunit A
VTNNRTLPFDDDGAEGGASQAASPASPTPFAQVNARGHGSAGDATRLSGGSSLLQRDVDARAAAVDPTRNIALSASAGTGKTRVLVDRYLNLLEAGVDPANILAMTFTRKAAAEMRERIVAHLRTAAARGEILPARWRELRNRMGDIAISTIDAFCLSLLRDFPLEADLDPGFDMADETAVPRLVEEALDHALRICRSVAQDDEDVALVFAQLSERRLREGLASLLDRRLVASDWLQRFNTAGPRELTASSACAAAVARLRGALTAVPGGLPQFLADGPLDHPRFALLARDIRALCVGGETPPPTRIRAIVDPLRDHFFTQEGEIRRKHPAYKADHCPSPERWKRHRDHAALIAPRLKDALDAFRRDLNTVLARGVWRMYQIALSEYRRTLEAHALLDFPEALARAIALLERMDEFAQSRFLLEARYHHVLVDEFQDTSRAQWRLVRLLVQSWAQGLGVGQDLPLEPSIFIVGDRKQSIYGFRDADVRVFAEAARFIDRLRPGTQSRRSIARSFRSHPDVLRFVNGLFETITSAGTSGRADAFVYDAADRFPIEDAARGDEPALGSIVSDDPDVCVEMVAAEIVRILGAVTVRDRDTGVRRAARPGDIAILFRSRETHREFEAALERRGVPTYVYKGLGFFDADEIKDVIALLRYLADPASNTRAAALLRSRIVRISDAGLQVLGRTMAQAIASEPEPESLAGLDEDDRRAMVLLRAGARGWLDRADRVPPADLLEEILDETAYAYELAGPRALQARENLKKIRWLVRRLQNHGYATLARIAEHLDRLSAGDEANAVIDALDAVNLMTVHASKGLEFPVVFLVNLSKGTGGRRAPIRVAFEGPGDTGDEAAEDEADESDGAPADGAFARLPSVAIGDFESDADTQREPRDAEETKRLLYVACTRARDRLYLSTVTKDGRVQPAPGSLARVLPASFQAFLSSCAVSPDPVLDWTDVNGERHRFARAASVEHTVVPRAAVETGVDDFARLACATTTPVAATEWLRVEERHHDAGRDGGRSSIDRRAAGAVVHQLLADVRVSDAEAARRRALELASGLPEARERFATHVTAIWEAFRSHPDVVPIITNGDVWFEVPFSLELDGTIVRGTIDAVARTRQAEVIVIEFKTGRPDDRHRTQLDLYLRAARALFPGSPVRGVLVYHEDPIRVA